MGDTRPTDLMRAMAEAARLAQRAPSVFNTQPWQWRVGPHSMELLSDPGRRLSVTDSAGRQLLLSCGAALHHARLGLAAAGRSITVTRFPDRASPDLLARIDVHGHAETCWRWASRAGGSAGCCRAAGRTWFCARCAGGLRSHAAHPAPAPGRRHPVHRLMPPRSWSCGWHKPE